MNAVLRSDPRLSPMTVAELNAVVAIEAAAYEFPWTRGNFIDSLAAGYLARVLRDKGSLDDARGILEASARKHTEDARPKNALAGLLRVQKQYPPARCETSAKKFSDPR